MGTAATPLTPTAAPASARPPWEALPDSAQRIYLALAGEDQVRARQLLEADRQAATRRRSRHRQRQSQGPRKEKTKANRTTATGRPASRRRPA